MPYVIGTDEAGYAPNLGPLVISATVWWVNDDVNPWEMYARLKHVVSRTPPKRPSQRLAIADSKQLYSTAAGIGQLERGVLACLALGGLRPNSWLHAWQLLDPYFDGDLQDLPWHNGYNLSLPLVADVDDLTQAATRLQRELEKAGMRLVQVASRGVFPKQFNESTRTLGNKSETLSQITLELVASALDACPDAGALVVCDKHGGRNFYGRLLQERFPDVLVEVYRESTAESVYRFGPSHLRREVRFCAGGEVFLPTALASMTSKYLRELAMRAFNEFWCTRVENLAPTAGYPGDAGRFHAAIRPLQHAMGIDDEVVWRER